MDDAAVRDLAHRAGIAVQWTDYTHTQRTVPLDSIRRILAALRLPCDTAADVAHSRHMLEQARSPQLITASACKPIHLPIDPGGERLRAHLIHEDGSAADLTVRRTARGISVAPIQTIGYHTLEIGQTRVALAVAPLRCVTIEDVAPGERLAGLAVQSYALRRAGDCGIGDMAGVSELVRRAGTLGVAALSLSPAHALFAADHNHFSPYSPSNRLFYNPLLADPAAVFGSERVERARVVAGLDAGALEHESAALIDWPKASENKFALLRCLFDDFVAHDLAGTSGSNLVVDFAAFRAGSGAALEQHAVFEVLHRAHLQGRPQVWDWRNWPAQWRNPHSAEVQRFRNENERDVLFHIFLQWISDRSLAKAQQQTKSAGMQIGLIADLAVGMSPGGSYAWASNNTLLGDLQIGAPPDLFNRNGQNWALTTFSPHALRDAGFAPFVATLRACMRHVGGLRIDHAMGFMRLWVIPAGAASGEGAYLAYPLDDLFRLAALESHRHRAIVIGEDLGTVPPGFRGRLRRAGIYGMSVLWFERAGKRFKKPADWPPEAVAMTSTHDLATVAGWWRGSDLAEWARCGVVTDMAAAQNVRNKERKMLWRALVSAELVSGSLPPPDASGRAVDAAVKFIAAASSRLALLPLEDALAMTQQPNLPGTVDEHPNWRRRYPGDAATLLDHPAARQRVGSLVSRGAT